MSFVDLDRVILMQLHQLQPIHKRKSKKRVGRGGKRGTYSGRGGKGQTARSGRKLQPLIREFIKRFPKLRGYRQKVRGKLETAVNISLLEENFKEGEKITPDILLEKRLISKIKGKMPRVKILGKGELKKKLVIEGCKVSKGAKEKIERAGGNVK